MKVSFEGIGESVVTFYNNASNGADAGVPVKMSGNGEVSKCADGDRFFGCALANEGDFAAVQTGGYVRMKYTGTAPAVGFALLAANATGGVKSVSTGGGEFLVVDVDTTGKTIGIML